MFSEYYEKDMIFGDEDKEILLDLYEKIAKEQGFKPDYDSRDLVDFSEDTNLMDTVLYHVENFGRKFSEWNDIKYLFEEKDVEKEILQNGGINELINDAKCRVNGQVDLKEKGDTSNFMTEQKVLER